MKSKIIFIFCLCFLSLTSLKTSACAVGGNQKVSFKEIQKRYEKKSRQAASSQISEFAKGHSSPSLEARLGNLLLTHPINKTSKIILSIPVQLAKGDWSPFGDGQKNAKMQLGKYWKESNFPVIGIETTQNATTTRSYRFHPSLNIQKFSEKALPDGWYEVRPEGHTNSYYFSFQTSALSVNEFLKGIPEKIRTFPKDRVAPNLAQISKVDSLKQLNENDLGPGFNSHNPWPASNVHGIFPGPEGVVTAIGGVLTWGVATQEQDRPKNGPFKDLYICFDPRDVKSESQQGVPSGAGWHYVGDPAETVFNNLSPEPIPFAMARAHGRQNSAYELTESITAMWLDSDEVQVTRKGEYHWYLNPYEQTVCTEIWVQNCIPDLSNNWGFNCH